MESDLILLLLAVGMVIPIGKLLYNMKNFKKGNFFLRKWSIETISIVLLIFVTFVLLEYEVNKWICGIIAILVCLGCQYILARIWKEK